MRMRRHRVTSYPPPRRTAWNETLLTAAVLAALVAAAPAQRQFDELRKRGLPADSDATAAVAIGDVDGDGDLDLVCGNWLGQNRLYLNDAGIYADATAAHLPPDSDATVDVALGDVDGDGDLDLVFGNYTTRHRLYLNNGAGVYTDASAGRMPTNTDPTSSMALGDVDGDGDLDLVFGKSRRHQNRLYLNDGTGTYADATARMPPDSDVTYAVALGDVDGDGDLDLVCGNAGQNRLYLNDGSGSYADATAARMPPDSDWTFAMAFGDVDGDGDLDLVLGNGLTVGQQNRLYLNDGAGTYTDATAARMPPDSDGTFAVALGDVDADGDLDLVLGNGGIGSGQNQLYLNDGTGTYADATTSRMPRNRERAAALAVADVDRDGDLDLVFGNGAFAPQQNALYLNDSSGTYADANAARMPSDDDETAAVALGDVDGDGDLDVVLGNDWGEQNRLYLNDGFGKYADATAARMPPDSDFTAAVALGDVDGDGDLDLVIGNSGPNRLYLNDGTGAYTDATAARMPPDSDSTYAVALGDVDNDGDLDLVVGNYGQQNRLYLNDGTGSYTDATAARMPPDMDGTAAAVLGDVDGDGDLDLVFGNDFLSGQQNRLYLNDGTGRYADATAARMPRDGDETAAAALGDVDGDGDVDLVFGNGSFSGRQNRLYLNDGNGTYVDATAARLPSDGDETAAAALGDVDGDGDLDLVFGNGPRDEGQQNRLYLNDGNGTYADATAALLPSADDATAAAALGDVDGDGDLDLVFGNLGSPRTGHQNRLYMNLQRQLDAPLLARIGQPYTLEVYARDGLPSLVDFALPVMSTASASIPWPPFGTLGVDPTRIVALPLVLIPRPAGVGSLRFTVPGVPALAGASVYCQAMLVPYPFQERLTNVTADVIFR